MAKILIPALIPQVHKVIIKHPVTGETTFQSLDGSEVQLIIHVVGRNSNQWLDFMRELKVSGSDDRNELFSRISEKSREFVAKLIVGWDENGAINESYSEEAALKLLMDANNTWILEQLQASILDENNFFLMSFNN